MQTDDLHLSWAASWKVTIDHGNSNAAKNKQFSN